MLAPIAWRTPPRHYGPWESVVSLLTEGLVNRGFDVTLFATADSQTAGKLHAVYRLGIALHDLSDPSKILGVANEWVLQPEDPWEITGYVHNVVFTCGAVAEDDGFIKIYWGGADTVMCVGTAQINDLANLCLQKKRPAVNA